MNLINRRTVTCVALLMIIPSPGMSAPDKNGNEKPVVINDACLELSENSSSLCLETSQWLVIKGHNVDLALENIQTSLKTREDLVRRHLAESEKLCGPRHRKACGQIRLLHAEIENISERRAESTKNRTAIKKRIDDAMRSIATMGRKLETPARVICKVRDTNRVDCVSVATMLSAFEAGMRDALTRDLARLYDVLQFGQENLLVECTPGAWKGMASSQLGMTPREFLMSLQQGDAALHLHSLCATSDGSSDPSSAGGFTGITGIGMNRGLPAICGADLNLRGSGINRLMKIFEDMTNRLNDKCVNPLIGSLIQGGGTEGDGSNGSGTAAAEETVTDNGDGTEMVCTEGQGCYIRYKAGTTSSTATPNDLNTVCKQDGTCKTSVRGLSPDNKPKTTTRTKFPDGTIITSDVKDDGTIEHYQIKAPNGSKFEMICKAGGGAKICDSDSAGPGEKLWKDREANPTKLRDFDYEDLLEFRRRLEQQNLLGLDCFDESCLSCADYSDFVSNIGNECFTSAFGSRECRSFVGEANCCSNPKAFPSDPRIVTPNQQGDFACMGDLKSDVQQQECKKRCSVASDTNCEAMCAAGSRRILEYDFLDAVCTQATWDACFSSSSQSGISPDDFGWSEPETPDLINSLFVVPPTSAFDQPDRDIRIPLGMR